MTFDLEAARALHDRAEYSPEYCGTCGDMNTSPVRWPCATATALGATGRTEWEGPMPAGIRVHFDTEPLPATTYRIHDAVDTCDAVRGPGDGGYTGPRIAADNPCILLNNHPGAHADRDSDRWEQQPDQPEADPWPNAADPCPEQSITGIPEKHCTQHRGHEGPHYFAWPGDYTPCRTPGTRPGTASFCSLGAGHRDAHRNLNGVAWSADERTLGHITPGTVRVTKLHPDGTLNGEPITTTGILNVQYATTADDRTYDNHWNRCVVRRAHTPGKRCILDSNHINQHEYHDDDALPDRCTASRERPGVSRITCALDKDHTTRYHVSPAGIHWGTNPDGPDAPTPRWLNAGNPCAGGPQLGIDQHRRCVFTHDHTGDHHYTDADTYTPCYTASGPQPSCILDATHIGAHRNLSGGTL